MLDPVKQPHIIEKLRTQLVLAFILQAIILITVLSISQHKLVNALLFTRSRESIAKTLTVSAELLKQTLHRTQQAEHIQKELRFLQQQFSSIPSMVLIVTGKDPAAEAVFGMNKNQFSRYLKQRPTLQQIISNRKPFMRILESVSADRSGAARLHGYHSFFAGDRFCVLAAEINPVTLDLLKFNFWLPMLFLLGLIMLLSILAAVLLAGKIASPLECFRNQLLKSFSSPTPEPVQVQGFDEIEQISRIYNGIADRLTGTVQRLEKEIQENIQSQQQLQHLIQFRDMIFDNADLWLNVLDNDGRILLWNKAAERISGWSADEVTGSREIWNLLYPDPAYRESILAVAGKILKDNVLVYDFSTEIITKQGAKKTVSWFSKAILETDAQGAVSIIGSLAIGRDISDFTAARSELAMYREIVETASQAIWIGSFDGTCHYANASFIKLVQSTQHQIRAVSLFQWFPEEYRTLLKDSVLPSVENNQSWTGELPLIALNQKIPISTLQTIFKLEQPSTGRDPLFVFMITDIETQKTADLEKKRMEQQLRQAQKMEAVGRLAGGVAHDFNNLLLVILGNAELALRKIDDVDHVSTGIEEIIQAGEKARRLTGQLLTFSKNQLTVKKPLSINQMIENMIHMLARLIGEDILIQTTLSDRDPYVAGDITQLEQVILNLAVNSRDAMGEKGGVISIKTEHCSFDHSSSDIPSGLIPGRYIRIVFSDNGPGLTPEQCRHLFEPFFTTRSHGTGLGLAVVYGIVSRHNGSISVESIEGTQTAFHIYLPETDPPERTVNTEIPSSDNEIIVFHPGMRVLLVEDDEKVREVVVEMLRQLQFHVLTSASFGEGMLLLRNLGAELDLLISDVVLPDGNGVQLVKESRALYPELLTVLCSGYIGAKAKMDEITSLEIPFIHKPFSLKELNAVLREALNGKEQNGFQ